MKRDWDLVREILVKLEELPPNSDIRADAIAGHDQPLVAYHMKIMHDRGLIDGMEVSAFSGLDFIAERLTWEGQEFLDEIRNDTVWNKVKGSAKDKGVDLTFDTIKALAAIAIKSLLGLD